MDEVIREGLANSTVLRDLGGSVLRSPEGATTVWDPSVQETEPSTGVEAALSAFDAQFTTSLFFENNDRAINNEFFGGGARTYTQDAAVHQMQLSKRSVSGTEFSARQIIEYDSSRDGATGGTLPGNLFDSAYTVKVEGEFRHPLMQGSGMQYNRIAGPTRTPGVYNGVLVARLQTDVELTEFEIAVRNLVSNLENAYWDLYFAYRDLDAKIQGRDAALDTWRRVQALYETGRRGGEAEKEAQAREQYYRFQEEVENALSGRLIDGTRTGNGSQAGTFRAAGGVYVAERRLRRLMNLSASDGALLRPAQAPVVAEVAFDWDQVMLEAVDRRAELRRQKWNIRRRELELIASKNHLLPRLDVVGRYRWRGFGDDLFEDGSAADPFNNAYDDLATGNFQEWQLGVELDIPLGYRQAHSAVRNAQLVLARERAVLCEQQQEVIHDVASAVAEVDRAFRVSQTSYNRLVASRNQLDAVKAAFESDKAPLNLYLDAQREVGGGREPLPPQRDRVRAVDQEHALRQGDAAGVRRRVPGRRGLAPQGLQRRGGTEKPPRQAPAAELRFSQGPHGQPGSVRPAPQRQPAARFGRRAGQSRVDTARARRAAGGLRHAGGAAASPDATRPQRAAHVRERPAALPRDAPAHGRRGGSGVPDLAAGLHRPAAAAEAHFPRMTRPADG